ncbi:class I SAM-dependent methyltransferase [Stutzerimonas sp. VN223-3]|uniref:TylF/MycF/NovP-related O-methyltransferase n=1 Tax=Stutzerimonas sp. VN223-3 TaxID=3384601 RepID=UPI0038B45692
MTSEKKAAKMPVEFTQEEKNIVSYVMDNKLTLVSYERLWATLMACKHAVERDIPGDFVECGVWRGGNAILAAAIFKLYGSDRRVYLFDTFKGMTEPTEADKYFSDGSSVREVFLSKQRDTHNEMYYSALEEVKANFAKANLLDENVIIVEGDVLVTLEQEQNLPDKIAVLRLDTDWYESTKKELEILYPRVSIGGSLIIDDYGHFTGSKKATDDYFEETKKRPLLLYTDYTGRIGVKYD